MGKAISRRRILDISCLSAGFIILILSYPFFSALHFDGYRFVTVSKVSGYYDEPIFLVFNWYTPEELIITGWPVQVWIETELPYQTSDSLKKIEVIFDGIAHYSGPSEDFQQQIATQESVTFTPDSTKEGRFKSDTINLRYASEGVKKIIFCDHNMASSCTDVNDVIEVAPFSTKFEVTIAKISLIGTMAVAILTVVLIWLTFRLEMSISKLDASRSSQK